MARLTTDPKRIDYIKLRIAKGATLKEIGEALGLTRERVRQLNNKYGVGPRICKVCSQSLHNKADTHVKCLPHIKYIPLTQEFVCCKCGKDFVLTGIKLATVKYTLRHKTTKVWCLECNETRVRGTIVVPCRACGEPVLREGGRKATFIYLLKRGKLKGAACSRSCALALARGGAACY